LFADGKGRVVDGAFLEVVLLGLLQFDDELFAPVVLSVDVIYVFAVNVSGAQLLGVFERQVHNPVLFGQQRIEKVDEQRFAGFFPEDFLESKVGVRIDISGFHPPVGKCHSC
jgi:hypothetical protein